MYYHLAKNQAYLRESIEDMIAHFDTSGELLMKGKRNTIKNFKGLNDEVFTVKRFQKPKKINAFIYKYIRLSKARRSFEYAERLIKCGINTPEPIAYIESKEVLGLRESFYISRYVNYDFDFRELIHNPLFENRTKILELFAVFCFKLHENNVNFLDHSPGNTLIQKVGKEYHFYLIDLNRMKFETMNLDQRMSNLRRLWLSKQMIQVISRKYAELCGESYDKVFHSLSKYSRDFKMKVNKKKFLKKKLKKK